MSDKLKTKLPKNDDWLSITVDINDGWADDVELNYPDSNQNSSPDCSNQEMNDDAFSTGPKSEEEIKQEKIELLKTKDRTMIKEKKIHGFKLFLIIWLSIITAIILISLASFYSYLVEYQMAYDNSRPDLCIEDLQQSFNELDIDKIYSLITLKPNISEFENEDLLKQYMLNLLLDKELVFAETSESTELTPSYDITSDGNQIAKIYLTSKPDSEDKYNFSEWYISNFEFYTTASHSVCFEKPSNYKVLINGVEVNDDYCTQNNINIPDTDIFKDYESVPYLGQYTVEGLYEEPTIVAYDCFGNETKLNYNEERKLYEVPFSNGPEFDKMIDYCVAAVEDYALFISGDIEGDAIDSYFPEGSEILSELKSGNARLFFTGHDDTSFDDIYIDEFELYSDKCLHCKISMVQHLLLGAHDTPIEINTDFYYVKYDDVWKIIYINH